MGPTSNPPAVVAGRYALEGVLGEGGMARVFRARHLALDARVAIKFLLRASDDAGRARFLNEARLTAQLKTRYAVQVFDFGVSDDGQPFLVLELLEGETLATLLSRRGRLSREETVRFVAQTARALERAHALGIVHRDLKPENLFVVRDEDGRPQIKVMDFGIAKLLGSLEAPSLPGEGARAVSQTSTGTRLGTPRYMAPEQVDAQDTGPAADVWALGVVAFVCLTGRPPFDGGDLEALFENIRKATPPPARTFERSVPPAFDVWVGRACARRPDDRFASPREAARALAAALDVAAERELGEPDADHDEAVDADDHPVTPGRAGAPDLTLDTALVGKTGSSAARVESNAGARLRAALAVVTVAAVVAGGGVIAVRAAKSRASAAPPAAPPAGPLAEERSVLACPPLDAAGVPDPAGWLGAAAASLACGRAQLLLGGDDARTLVPAELLDLPAEPTDDYPHDPYGENGARDRAVTAARTRAKAFLDGHVEWSQDQMHVALSLRDASGAELARGEGASPFLFRAVRSAVDALRGPRGLPDGDPPSAALREWLGAGSLTSMLALRDAATACRLEAAGVCREECAGLAGRTDFTPSMASFISGMCVVSLPPHAPEPSEPPALDASTTAALVAGASARAIRERHDEATGSALEAALARETSPGRRALLACERMSNAGEADERREDAILAIRALPEDSDPRCTAWHELPFVWTDSSYAPAFAAWAPWDPLAQDRLGDLEHASLVYGRRAYVLSPESFWANSLARRLLSSGLRVEAASVLPHTTSPSLRVAALAAEARFGAALDLAHTLVESALATSDAATAFDVAHAAAPVALILGRPLDDVDAMVTAFVDPDPVLAVKSLSGFFAVLATCTLAPSRVARRCLDKLEVVRTRGELEAIFPLAQGAIAGARRYVEGDFGGAVAAWKPLLRAPGDPLKVMRDPVAMALDRQGELDLAEKLDKPKAQGGAFNGADLVLLRAARRAEKQGDHARARALAQRIVDAWSVADVPVPAVAEMQRLLARP